MFQIIVAIAWVVIIAMLVSSAAALTYTAICIIAGVGVGCVATLAIVYSQWGKQQERQEQLREREHQRLKEIIQLARMTSAHVDVSTLELPRSTVPRIGKR